MADSRPIADEEVILKRVRANDSHCIRQYRGGYRATSFAIRIPPGQEGSSCSRLQLTSPRTLLSLVTLQGKSPDDYLVCRIRVTEVRALNLDVLALPTDEDPGHCEIRKTVDQHYPASVWTRLAKTTRILTPEEVATLQAGDEVQAYSPP